MGSWYRSLKFRRVYRATKLRIRAATRVAFSVQAWFRGYCARDYVQRMRHARRLRLSATFIQAHYRGFRARRRTCQLAEEKRRNDLYDALREMRDTAPKRFPAALREMRDAAFTMLPVPPSGYQGGFAQGEGVAGYVKPDTAIGSLANIDLNIPELAQEQDFDYAFARAELGRMT